MTTPTQPGRTPRPGTGTNLGPATIAACLAYDRARTPTGTEALPRSVVEAYLSEALAATTAELASLNTIRQKLIHQIALTTDIGPRRFSRLTGIPVSSALRTLNDIRSAT